MLLQSSFCSLSSKDRWSRCGRSLVRAKDTSIFRKKPQRYGNNHLNVKKWTVHNDGIVFAAVSSCLSLLRDPDDILHHGQSHGVIGSLRVVPRAAQAPYQIATDTVLNGLYIGSQIWTETGVVFGLFNLD